MAVHQIDDAEIRRAKAVVYILSAIVLVSVSAFLVVIIDIAGGAC